MNFTNLKRVSPKKDVTFINGDIKRAKIVSTLTASKLFMDSLYLKLLIIT